MADKHRADPWMRPRTLLESVMADGLSAHRDAIHEALRRIPALEAERDALRETLGKVAILLHAAGMPSDRVTVMDGVEMLTKDRDTQEEAVGELRAMLAQQIAERDALRAELATITKLVRGDPL